MSQQKEEISDQNKITDTLKAQILRMAPIPIALHDSELTVVWANKAYEEATGIPLQEMVGKKCYIVWGLSKQCRFCPVVTAITTRRPDEAELSPQNQDHWPETQGSWLAQAVPVFNQDGRILGAIESAIDITERRQAEEALRKSEIRYRTLFDSIDEGFCIIQVIFDKNNVPVDYQLLELNPSFEKLTKLTAARGKRMSEITPRRIDKVFEIFGQIALTGQQKRFQYRSEQLNRWYDLYAFRYGRPEDSQVAVLFKDITEQKQTEEELRRSRDELDLRVRERTVELRAAYKQRDYLSHRLVELLERERRDIGNALHDEIGQIIAGVVFHIDNLKTAWRNEDTHPEEKITAIQELLRAAVKQTRKISRQLRSESLERYGLVPAISGLVENIKSETGVTVHFFTNKVPKDLREEGKDLVIYRVVQESLANAIKYAESDEIFVNLIGRDRLLSLTIEDNGRGFTYDAVSKRQNGKGGPLGLTIMRERVAQVGGQFYVESAPNSGTQILVEIPLQSIGKF